MKELRMLDIVVGLKIEEELSGIRRTSSSCLPIGWATNYYVLKALASLPELESVKSLRIRYPRSFNLNKIFSLIAVWLCLLSLGLSRSGHKGRTRSSISSLNINI